MPRPAHPVEILLPLPLTPTNDVHDKPPYKRRRSSTFTAITNWALAVQPGSPAPTTPDSRRPSLSRRIAHRRVPSGSPSFVHLVDTPTTANKSISTPYSAKDFPGDVDLTNWGYTSVFVRFPGTPQTPSPFRAPATPAVSSKPSKGLKKIKSMGILRSRTRTKSVVGSGDAPSTPTRPRSRSRSGSISPTKPTAKRPGHNKSKSFSASVSRSKSAKANPPPLPATLQTELLLMQFTGGGSLESHAQRVMQQRAKATRSGAVDAVYKDENGVMWLDEDERVEREALLATAPSSPTGPWVQFSVNEAELIEDPIRRGSVTSMTPTERELEGAASIVRPASPSAYVGVNLSSVGPSSTADRSERRRRRRPAPLKLNSESSVPTIQNQFDDAFEPSSAEVAALAAGMHVHLRGSRRASGSGGSGSAPAHVTDFEGRGRKLLKKGGLAKRAKALFGMD